MKKEVAVWKDAADHNSQAAKLFAEKSALQSNFDSLQQELKQTPESMSAQIRSLTELTESLNQYLKQFCEESKKHLENELVKAKSEYESKIEKLQERIDEMKKSEAQREQKAEVEWNSVVL